MFGFGSDDAEYLGRIGEEEVNGELCRLPKSEYSFYENLLLPTGRGDSTQIDHVVFSQFGVFVIETKNFSGWIFAGKNDKVWTQRFHTGRKHTFQNPLRQNYKHVRALQQLTRLPPRAFYNIVVFTGNAEFKTPEPEGLLYAGELARFIMGRRQKILTQPQVNNAVAAVLSNTGQFIPGAMDGHVRNLREKYKKPARISAGGLEEYSSGEKFPAITSPAELNGCLIACAVILLLLYLAVSSIYSAIKTFISNILILG